MNMKKKTMKIISKSAGCTLIGKSHIDLGIINQDSFIIREYSFGTVMVVADGLGSLIYSNIGSKMVCEAVCEASKIWINNDNKNIRNLIKLIHILWEMKISPYEKNDCGTTCLFSLVINDTNRVIIGQIGDGLLAYITGNELSILKEKNDDFLNITNSMHNVKKFSEWTYDEFILESNNLTLLMCTDGISEDIVENKQKEFILELESMLTNKKSMKQRNKKLKKILKAWKTPYSDDDKTIILYMKKGE